MDSDERPELDPEPIPNIVLHPGDTLAIGAYAHQTSVAYVRLLDRNGNCYAVLDCERTYPAADNRWLVHAIRSVTPGERVLPVRAEPEPHPHTKAHPQPNDDPNLYLGGINVAPTHPDARSRNLILSNFGRVTDLGPTIDDRHYPYPGEPGATTDGGDASLNDLRVRHAHTHFHEYGAGAAGYTEQHAHFHEHSGADALSRAHAYDHGSNDLHAHDHPDTDTDPR